MALVLNGRYDQFQNSETFSKNTQKHFSKIIFLKLKQSKLPNHIELEK